jgi:hypothetical protein
MIYSWRQITLLVLFFALVGLPLWAVRLITGEPVHEGWLLVSLVFMYFAGPGIIFKLARVFPPLMWYLKWAHAKVPPHAHG